MGERALMDGVKSGGIGDGSSNQQRLRHQVGAFPHLCLVTDHDAERYVGLARLG